MRLALGAATMTIAPFAYDSVRCLSALAALSLALALPAVAHARVYGERHITTNTNLTDDQFGSIIIDADHVELNCQGHQIHISSYTRPNCLVGGKCGIFLAHHSQVNIFNCNIVGEFDAGIDAYDSEYANLFGNSVTVGSGIGILVHESSNLIAQRTTVSSRGYGLFVDVSDGTTFDGLVIDGANVGIEADHSYGSDFEHLNVTNSFQGLVTRDGYGELLEESAFENNESALLFIDTQKIWVVHNTVSDSVSDGLSLTNVDGADIRENTITTSGSCDATMRSSANTTWELNTFTHICGDVPSRH